MGGEAISYKQVFPQIGQSFIWKAAKQRQMSTTVIDYILLSSLQV